MPNLQTLNQKGILPYCWKEKELEVWNHQMLRISLVKLTFSVLTAGTQNTARTLTPFLFKPSVAPWEEFSWRRLVEIMVSEVSLYAELSQVRRGQSRDDKFPWHVSMRTLIYHSPQRLTSGWCWTRRLAAQNELSTKLHNHPTKIPFYNSFNE